MSSKVADLRKSVEKTGYFTWAGGSKHDAFRALQVESRAAASRTELKLKKVESLMKNASFPQDEFNTLVIQKAEAEAANELLNGDMDDLHRTLQDKNLFCAIRSTWDEIRLFGRTIASSLVRVTIRASKQIVTNVQRWLE
jgi:hypothetical protein